MADIGKEFDFPTVRRGSYLLFFTLGLIVTAVLTKGPDRELSDMFAACLTAIGATHALLVLGGGFLNSKLAAPKESIEETVTTTRTVAPAATPAKVDTVNVAAENVNVT